MYGYFEIGKTKQNCAGQKAKSQEYVHLKSKLSGTFDA